MSNPNPERDERVRQIRERLSLLGSHYPSGSDPRTVALREALEDSRYLLSQIDLLASTCAKCGHSTKRLDNDGICRDYKKLSSNDPHWYPCECRCLVETTEVPGLKLLLEDFGTLYGRPLSHEHADLLWNNAATHMRDRCVEKLGQVRDNHLVSNNEHYEKGFNAALKCVEVAIRSLTLDGSRRNVHDR